LKVIDWDKTLGLEVALDAYPEPPAAYDGVSFTNTESEGGYGAPSAYTYNQAVRGYKPFGALG
jgi:hypothetical protein